MPDKSTNDKIMASKHKSLIIKDFCLKIKAVKGNSGKRGVIIVIDIITRRGSQFLVYKTNAAFWLFWSNNKVYWI